MTEEDMDFTKVPIGFSMALVQNEDAMQSYVGMTREQKLAVLSRAHGVRSEKEMTEIVADIAKNGMR